MTCTSKRKSDGIHSTARAKDVSRRKDRNTRSRTRAELLLPLSKPTPKIKQMFKVSLPENVRSGFESRKCSKEGSSYVGVQ